METLVPGRLFRINNNRYLVVKAYDINPGESICLQCALYKSKNCLQHINGDCIGTIGLDNVLKQIVEVEKLTAISGWKKVCRR